MPVLPAAGAPRAATPAVMRALLVVVEAVVAAAESAKLAAVLATAAMPSTRAFAVREAAAELAEAVRMAAAARPPGTDSATVA